MPKPQPKPKHTPSIVPALLRLEDAAAYLAVSTWTVQRWLKRGQFPNPVRLTAGSVRWRRTDLDHFIEKRGRSRSPKPELRGALRERAEPTDA